VAGFPTSVTPRCETASTIALTTAGGADYQKWYYRYDEKGLKQKDECFGKNKMMIGKVEYKYQ